MSSGISATQLVQLVAQKLTSTTCPRSALSVVVDPSINKNLDCGAAAFEPQLANANRATQASQPRHVVAIRFAVNRKVVRRSCDWSDVKGGLTMVINT